MFAAVTDHVFVDGGHTIDFTNKAFEVLDHLGWDAAPEVLTTLVAQTAAASRSEEQGSWRYPVDLTAMLRAATAALPDRLAEGARHDTFDHTGGVAVLAWALLAEDPAEVVGALDAAIAGGATPEEVARAVAYAAALRITRFHTQNDHGDWDEVHHAFTAANALHQAVTPRRDTRTAPRRVPQRAARLPRPLPQHPGGAAPRAAGVGRGCRPRPACRRAGTRKAASTKPEPSCTATCAAAVTRRSRSRRSDTRCSPRTPSSTGSRPTRRPSASSTPGRTVPRSAR